MSLSKIKVKNKEANYSIIIGNKAILALPSEIKRLCPKTKKIGIVIDKKVPKQFKSKLKNNKSGAGAHAATRELLGMIVCVTARMSS